MIIINSYFVVFVTCRSRFAATIQIGIHNYPIWFVNECSEYLLSRVPSSCACAMFGLPFPIYLNYAADDFKKALVNFLLRKLAVYLLQQNGRMLMNRQVQTLSSCKRINVTLSLILTLSDASAAEDF